MALEQAMDATGDGAHPALTLAELRVLQAVADHGDLVSAASVLFISPRTVEVHLRRIRRKLELPTTVQCVVFGLRAGLIE